MHGVSRGFSALFEGDAHLRPNSLEPKEMKQHAHVTSLDVAIAQQGNEARVGLLNGIF